MLSEKFEKNVLILELPYNIGICTNIAHTNSLHPPKPLTTGSLCTVGEHWIYFHYELKSVALISGK